MYKIAVSQLPTAHPSSVAFAELHCTLSHQYIVRLGGGYRAALALQPVHLTDILRLPGDIGLKEGCLPGGNARGVVHILPATRPTTEKKDIISVLSLSLSLTHSPSLPPSLLLWLAFTPSVLSALLSINEDAVASRSKVLALLPFQLHFLSLFPHRRVISRRGISLVRAIQPAGIIQVGIERPVLDLVFHHDAGPGPPLSVTAGIPLP
jgi:hypothetical protein